jgi:hypothetical protein
VFIQGVGRRGNAARKCLDLVDDGTVYLCLRPDVLAEIDDVLHRPEILRKFPLIELRVPIVNDEADNAHCNDGRKGHADHEYFVSLEESIKREADLNDFIDDEHTDRNILYLLRTQDLNELRKHCYHVHKPACPNYERPPNPARKLLTSHNYAPCLRTGVATALAGLGRAASRHNLARHNRGMQRTLELRRAIFEPEPYSDDGAWSRRNHDLSGNAAP